MFTAKRKLYSQNFLCNRQLVEKLVRSSSVGPSDTVLEIGAGDGAITKQLIKVAEEVVAIELDSSFFQRLKERFNKTNNLKLIQGDFLDLQLPVKPYKVFANIPFSRTGDIVRKLLLNRHSPSDSYIVMQREAADKFIVKSRDNSMMSILLFPWWEIKSIYEFKKSDFIPSPSVDVVLVQIKKKEAPLLSNENKSLFCDFVASSFNRKRNSRNTPPTQWIRSFNDFSENINLNKMKTIKGTFDKLQKEQSRLVKIRRTRLDKQWKKFGG